MNNKTRLQIHEKVLHDIHFARLYNHEKLFKYLALIAAWSFAVNGDNGTATEYEIRKRQDELLLKMGEI